jgi:hypothetical protein
MDTHPTKEDRLGNRYELVQGDAILRVFDTVNKIYIASCGFGYRNSAEQLVMLANNGWKAIKP